MKLRIEVSALKTGSQTYRKGQTFEGDSIPEEVMAEYKTRRGTVVRLPELAPEPTKEELDIEREAAEKAAKEAAEKEAAKKAEAEKEAAEKAEKVEKTPKPRKPSK